MTLDPSNRPRSFAESTFQTMFLVNIQINYVRSFNDLPKFSFCIQIDSWNRIRVKAIDADLIFANDLDQFDCWCG